ncbi:response regulator transcription factor (plasmid) [Aliiroseovarius crassostreae]|uniref:response regulator transcription factor n=1 Tax=Aliiroseovarius crassostreae TaxID=154981 RepID=UPI0021FD67F9|nr:response regulator transcription factor [Aliiroseovarius crassostreae]UWQ03533.1 response regulator transcription factor [Aliiroseovarius crassostreae]
MRVLILDDDQELGPLMRQGLAKYGIDLHLAFTPQEAFARLESEPFDVLVLDMMLPGQDGMSVCRDIRQSNKPFNDIPILAQTARADVTDRIVALESGFDDFIAKPAEMRELVARIGAVTRRGRVSVPAQGLARETLSSPDRHPAGFTLSEAHLSASFQGFTVNLTELELRVLQALNDKRGQCLSRNDILDRIGYTSQTDPAIVDTVIYRVRHKFRLQGLTDDFIRTLRGQGYSLKVEQGV